jgi:hypothetical protein
MTKEEIARIKALGVRGFMQEIAENKHCQPTSLARDEAEALLRSMQAEEDAARDSETRSIALRANRIAWIAAAIAIIASAIAAKDEILRLIFGQP